MKFPEWLYSLLPGDAGTQLISIIWREASSAVANASVSVTMFVVPKDKVLVLTNVTGLFDPGAAQGCFERRVMADPPEGTTRYNILHSITGGTADVVTDANWQGEVIIPGGWKVKVEGTFTAAIAANLVEGEMHGYLVPRGTFIFG